MEYDGIPYRVISPDAEIGEGTRIMPFVTIGNNAKIGKNCYIGQGCVVDAGAVIENQCYIGRHVIISRGVHIRDNVFIGDNCVLGTADILTVKAQRVIERVYLDIEAAANICSNCTIRGGVSEKHKTVIGEKVFISDGCVIYSGVTIGSYTFLAPMVYAGCACSIGERCAIAAQTIIGDAVTVKDKVGAVNRVIFENKNTYPEGVYMGQKCIIKTHRFNSDVLAKRLKELS